MMMVFGGSDDSFNRILNYICSKLRTLNCKAKWSRNARGKNHFYGYLRIRGIAKRIKANEKKIKQLLQCRQRVDSSKFCERISEILAVKWISFDSP